MRGDCPNFRGHHAQHGRENGTVPFGLNRESTMPATRRHFIQYHNGVLYGPPSPELVAHSDKRIDALQGQVLWVIAGQGRPRQYTLAKVFVVDEVGDLPPGEMRHYARGSVGRFFDPSIALDGHPWFRAFRQQHANFSLGLREIHGAHILALENLAAEHGYTLP